MPPRCKTPTLAPVTASSPLRLAAFLANGVQRRGRLQRVGVIGARVRLCPSRQVPSKVSASSSRPLERRSEASLPAVFSVLGGRPKTRRLSSRH